jgi:hypothetical protein
VTIEPRHVTLALDVRRGLVRLRDVTAADAPAVSVVLRRTTDAQFAVMAQSQEHRTPRASRCTPHRTWHARTH